MARKRLRKRSKGGQLTEYAFQVNNLISSSRCVSFHIQRRSRESDEPQISRWSNLLQLGDRREYQFFVGSCHHSYFGMFSHFRRIYVSTSHTV